MRSAPIGRPQAVHVVDDSATPLLQGTSQFVLLTQDMDGAEAWAVEAVTGGFDAKFFPYGASDEVTYSLDDDNHGTVTVPAGKTVTVTLGRLEVAEVAVTTGNGTTMVEGTWIVERSNGTAYERWHGCSYVVEGSCRNYGLGELATGRGGFAPDGKYRLTVRWRPESGKPEESKQYQLSLP